MPTNTPINGFKGDPGPSIAKVMARRSGDTFVREMKGKGKSQKSAQAMKQEYVKQGILAYMYAHHVLGQQLPSPVDQGGMGMGMDPSMDPSMAMGGMAAPPVDPNAPGMY